MSTMLWLCIAVLGLAAIVSALLLPHRRLTTLLAASLAFFEVYWLLGVLLAQQLRPDSFLPALLVIAFMMCGGAAVGYIKNKQPFIWRGSGWADMAVLLVVGVVLVGASVVNSANGLRGTDFVMHGFYNGDVVTFASLVQKAIVSSSITPTNPFAGNGDLEYPTLLHRGFAGLFTQTTIGLNWLYFWPLLVYVQIIITIPLLFLLWDTLVPPPPQGELWLGLRAPGLVIGAQALLTISVLTLSWDNYIYPQSHFFLTAAWLLLGAILFSRRSKSIVQIILGFSVAVVLLLSNAVTGTAAVALFGIYVVSSALERDRPWALRLGGLTAAAALVVLFLVATPGNAALGSPHFSYAAVADIARLTPWLILLLVGVALQFTRFSKESAAILGVAGLTLIVFLFSTRDIVVANASRFIYHALLLGLPLVFRPLIRTLWYLRREFLLSSRSLVESAVGAMLVVLGLFTLVVPSLGSVASAYDNLLFNDEQRVSFQRREVLWWLAEHTPPDSIIIAHPQAPWDIPLFSGRALLRASNDSEAYWLSRDDEVLHRLQAAFAGDRAAQKEIIGHGDFLVLTNEERAQWPVTLPPVFETKQYQVLKLR